MKLHTFLLLVLALTLTACHQDDISPPLSLDGVDMHYALKGEIEGRNFEFFQGENERYIVIGHRGYLKSWETVFERSSSTEKDGYIRLLYQFPINMHTLDAMPTGKMAEGIDGCRWKLELSLPDATNQMIHYGWDSKSWDKPVDFGRGLAPKPPTVLERSPILIDETGKPYFDVRLEFRTILYTLDEKRRQAPFVAEGLFRVYLCEEDEER